MDWKDRTAAGKQRISSRTSHEKSDEIVVICVTRGAYILTYAIYGERDEQCE